jgi:predicted signal transduction protein with EAL and GGDEF domain
VRGTDTVARFGGDEFVVLLPSTGSVEAVEATAARIVTALAEQYVLDGVKLTSGTSIGVAFAQADYDTRERMLNRADVALYAAKAAGRGQYRMFEQGMDAMLLERQQLEYDVMHALEQNELFLMFQPLLDTVTLKIVGFEALLRWTHPVRGEVPVSTLIQTAEETGAIMKIGAWTLQQACAEAMHWPDNIWLSVNVSPVQFRSGDLTGMILDAASSTGLAPSRLEIEITESILLRNEIRTIQALHVLRENGVRISIDDFGVGHASLKYLLDFPLDRIKIDQVFTKKLIDDPKAGAIMTAIINLGHNIGVRTTIEGIETEEQLHMPCVQDCSEVQGYFFSPPVLPNGIPALLERFNNPVSDVAMTL